MKSKYYFIVFLFFLPCLSIGQCWELVFEAPMGVGLRGIQFVNDSVGWIYGDNNANNSIFKTTDGGDTWLSITIPEPDFGYLASINSLYFLNEEKGWATAKGNPLTYKTENGGNSWDLLYYPDSIDYSNVQKVQFLNNNRGWMVTSGGEIISTLDGGLSLGIQIIPSNFNISFHDVCFIDESTGWIVGSLPPYTQGILLGTQNGGLIWEEVLMPFKEIWEIDFYNNSIGWILTQRNQIYKTVDGGENWVPYLIRNDTSCCSDPNQIFCCPSFNFYSMDFVNDTLGWAGANAGYGMYVSTDGGETWDKQNFDYTKAPRLSMINDTLGFMCAIGPDAFYNRVYRYRGRPANCTSIPIALSETTLLPTYTWSSAEGCFDGYYFQLGSSPGAEDILARVDVTLDTFYQVADILPENTEVYATVTPYNHVYGAAEACESSSFTTITCPPSPMEIDTGYCKGVSLLWGDSLISQPGQYSFSGVRVDGCDTTAVLNVIQYEDPVTPIDTAYCQGDDFYWQDSLLAGSGAYHFNYTSARGCDSTVIVFLEEILSVGSQIDTLLCEGTPYIGQDTTILEEGYYTFYYQGEMGCDSLVQLNLSYSPIYNFELDTFYCEGEELYWDGVLLSAGIHTFEYTTTVGCDSIWQIQVDERSDVMTQIDTALLEGEPYLGVYYTTDTLLSFVYPAGNGCDSLVVVTLDVISQSNAPIHEEYYLLVYPNPTSDIISLEVNTDITDHGTLSVFNAMGALIDTQYLNLSSMPYHLSTKDWSAGVYFLRLDIDRHSYFCKIVTIH